MEKSENHLREEDDTQDGVMGGKLKPIGTGGRPDVLCGAKNFGVLRMQILGVREMAQWLSVLFLQRT